MQHNNTQKTVIITGAARRIGRGLALRFAKAGYNLALHYHTSEQQAQALLSELQHFPVKAALYKADLREDNQVESMFLAIQQDFSSADILVSNAAVYPYRKTLDEIPTEFIDEIFSTNCLAHYRCVKNYTSIASGGHIVLFASLGAHETWKGRLPYNISKVAALQLSRSLARELAPAFCVNAVSPGSIEIPDDPATEPLIPVNKIPMQRQGTVDDIFSAVYYFSTCPLFITGQELLVDGGYHLSR